MTRTRRQEAERRWRSSLSIARTIKPRVPQALRDTPGLSVVSFSSATSEAPLRALLLSYLSLPHIRLLTPSSTAAAPQSSPWQRVPSFIPARAIACSSLSTVNNPNTTGTPESSCTRIKPWEVASAMYSKCIVSPLMSTPMAIMASKGAADAFAAVGAESAGGEVGRAEKVRSVTEVEPRRSVAEDVNVFVEVEDWICDAAYILGKQGSVMEVSTSPVLWRARRQRQHQWCKRTFGRHKEVHSSLVHLGSRYSLQSRRISADSSSHQRQEPR